MIKNLSARTGVPATLASGLDPMLIQTGSAEQILNEYAQYLDRTLGAALSTQRGYLYFARQFLTYAFKSMDPEWKVVRAELVAQFVQQEAAPRKGNGRKTPGYATRAFLRYLVLHGFLPAGIDAAVPVIRVWAHTSLPGHLSTEEIARLLTVSADGSPIGKRNYAILTLFEPWKLPVSNSMTSIGFRAAF